MSVTPHDIPAESDPRPNFDSNLLESVPSLALTAFTACLVIASTDGLFLYACHDIAVALMKGSTERAKYQGPNSTHI